MKPVKAQSDLQCKDRYPDIAVVDVILQTEARDVIPHLGNEMGILWG